MKIRNLAGAKCGVGGCRGCRALQFALREISGRLVETQRRRRLNVAPLHPFLPPTTSRDFVSTSFSRSSRRGGFDVYPASFFLIVALGARLRMRENRIRVEDKLRAIHVLNLGDRCEIVERYEARCVCVKCEIVKRL